VRALRSSAIFAVAVIMLALAACGGAPAPSEAVATPIRATALLARASDTASPSPPTEPTRKSSEDDITDAAGEPTRLSPSCGQPTYVVTSTERAPGATLTPEPLKVTATPSARPSTATRPPPSTTPTLTATATALPPTSTPAATATPQSVRIAVIGDFGLANPAEGAVASLVKGWAPDAVATLGDNNYPFGSPETIDGNIGRYYAEFIHPYRGAFGPGGDVNRFFPALGNHDWMDPGAQAYLDYFTLAGNERYYDVRLGPVHLFVLDSQPDEPDGITADSRQGAWLQAAMAASDAPWKLVTMHHPPYSSGPHAPVPALRWPFAEWGATGVLAGHDHIYERIERDGILYFVNGLGGTITYDIGSPVEGSQVRYNQEFGAMLVEATADAIRFSFVTADGDIIDSRTITR